MQHQHQCQHQRQQNDIPTLKLSHLPLRPSTLSLLTRKGFHSTADVCSSKSAVGGGVSNFASELEIPLVDAVRIGREVEDAARSVMPSDSGNGNGSGSGSGSGSGTSTNSNSNNNIVNVYQQRRNNGGPDGHTGQRVGHHHQQEQEQQEYHRRKRRAPQTAAAILSSHYNEPMSFRPIISFVRSIDSLLGGGFHPKELIEVAGLPGVGRLDV